MKFSRLFRNWEDVKEYPAGSVISSERDPGDVMYVILSGEIELTLHGEPLSTEGKGGIIGEMAMTKSSTGSATATALSDVKLARLDRGQLRELIDEDTEFSFHVMSELANRLRAVDNFITTQFEKQK